jgi:hypothetical protein
MCLIICLQLCLMEKILYFSDKKSLSKSTQSETYEFIIFFIYLCTNLVTKPFILLQIIHMILPIERYFIYSNLFSQYF